MINYNPTILVVVSCTLLYGCGTMPSPNSLTRNSSPDLAMNSSEKSNEIELSNENRSNSQQVLSKSSLHQVLKRNGIEEDSTSNVESTLGNSSNSSPVINHTEKDRHTRILAAIKTTEEKNSHAAVTTASTKDASKPNGKQSPTSKIAKLQVPKKTQPKVVVEKKPVAATRKNSSNSNTPKSKKSNTKFNENAVKYTLANRYYQSGKYQNSIDILESSKDDLPKNIRNRDLLVLAYTAYARELVSKAELLEAQTVLEKALDMQPKNKTIRRQLSGIKDVREADKVYKKAIDAYNKGERQSAFKSFARVLSLNPSHKKAKKYYSKIKTIVIDTYHKKALQFYRRQKLSQAIVEWNSLLKVDPSNDLARIYRSRAIELQKKFEKL